MVNGNYVLYGDRPSSETEIVDDHVHTRTTERKNKRKANRTANELQHSLNLAQLDNETDSIKYEKKIKEPRLLRYVPTTDVEENFVTEKFETYDLKPTEERPRRYAFVKKPRNPTDGSINYAYSRSSSSCSSPNGNLPTISEHCEQYGTYRVHSAPNAAPTVVGDIITGYESKLDKYFAKPRDTKKFTPKGSHPDSLYRVSSGGLEDGKVSRALRVLRWPVALVAVCVALAVFVYFLMPDNLDMDAVNGTYWEPVAVTSQFQNVELKSEPALKQDPVPKPVEQRVNKTKPPELKSTQAPARPHGSKTAEIDFYNAVIDNNHNINADSKLPAPPVFPSHITPEVQYGNERADNERTAKVLDATNALPEDSTLKPHITHKPERPLAIYLKDINVTTPGTTETITRAESTNDFSSYEEKDTTNGIVAENLPTTKAHRPLVYKEYPQIQRGNPRNDRQSYDIEPHLSPEVEEFYSRPVNTNFTSGHSKVFGISIEEAGRMQSTTQSSLYNTRVSPTLPTWRDGDDSTTKKYPVTTNSEVPQCRSPRLAMCRGVLPYDLAAAPISILGNPVTSLLPQLQYLVASNCSDRARHFACAMLEPECNPAPFEPKMPCFNLCRAVADGCDGQMPRELMEMFACENYNYGYTSCVPAKAPCFAREISCGDGTCVPRDWICDGTTDCPSGVDEKSCSQCDQSEHRCQSGTCIQKRWLCDGYSDCPDGDDETEAICEKRELGEEPSGSAPAPSVRRPLHTVESDSSKELLMTSDTNNALKRNFTRRPSLSRLTPYSHPAATSNRKPEPTRTLPKKNQRPVNKPTASDETNIDHSKFFEDFEKLEKDDGNVAQVKTPMGNFVNIPSPDMVEDKKDPAAKAPTRLDKSINNLERVIDGAAMLRKAAAQQEEEEVIDSPESNNTSIENAETPKQPGTGGLKTGPVSVNAHVSTCQSGELRCVDGRCITLAQLCDGTIDCSDHADEDNCYT